MDPEVMKVVIMEDPYAPADDFVFFLQRLRLSIKSGPYIHSHPISFSTEEHKTNWITHLEDVLHRHTIEIFYKAPKNEAKTWIGFFNTETVNFVSHKKWKEAAWHCYAIAIIQDPKKGKHMLVYDPDPHKDAFDRRARITRVLRGAQRNLFNYMRGKRKTFPTVWYSIDKTHRGKNRCVLHTSRKIREWAAWGDLAWQGPNDPRKAGCVRLNRI